MISKDELASWDPDIRDVEVVGKNHINIYIDEFTSTLTFTKEELERLIKEIDNG